MTATLGPETGAPTAVAERVRRLVVVASGGSFGVEDLDQVGGVLADVGLDSIGTMNLLEGLERSFGVIIDPERDPAYLNSVHSIVAFLADQLGEEVEEVPHGDR